MQYEKTRETGRKRFRRGGVGGRGVCGEWTDGQEGNRKGKERRFLRRKEGRQKKLFLHQCFIIFIHSVHEESLSRLATTSKPMLSPVIQSKSGAIVSFP